jgi:hypothetical protein
MRWLITLISAISLIVGCDGNPDIGIEENAKQQFGALPGKIGITLENSSGAWHQIIEQGRIIKVDSLPRAQPEAATILRKSFDSPAGLPPQKGYVYWGPYAASPNKRYMAACVAMERHAGGSPGFAIIDRQSSTTLAIVIDPLNRYIKSLAWSPDSQWVAALKSSSELSALDRLLITLTGHASPSSTWHLEVVNLTGAVVSHTKLAELRGSWGWVVWLE